LTTYETRLTYNDTLAAVQTDGLIDNPDQRINNDITALTATGGLPSPPLKSQTNIYVN
jgi:ABC-type uncharacterized transport system fused permease/ATPase subunit